MSFDPLDLTKKLLMLPNQHHQQLHHYSNLAMNHMNDIKNPNINGHSLNNIDVNTLPYNHLNVLKMLPSNAIKESVNTDFNKLLHLNTPPFFPDPRLLNISFLEAYQRNRTLALAETSRLLNGQPVVKNIPISTATTTTSVCPSAPTLIEQTRKETPEMDKASIRMLPHRKRPIASMVDFDLKPDELNILEKQQRPNQGSLISFNLSPVSIEGDEETREYSNCSSSSDCSTTGSSELDREKNKSYAKIGLSKEKQTSNVDSSSLSLKSNGKTSGGQLKDEAYWERRRKNNEAAKRSRDTRRQKEEEIAQTAQSLAEENLGLKAQIKILSNELSNLHSILLYQARAHPSMDSSNSC